MTPEDYPALFHSADESSVNAQSNFLWLIRLQYGLLITAAGVSLWFDNAPVLLLVYAFIVGASMALLDAQETLRSVTGFAEIQSIGRMLENLPAYDDAVFAALRVIY